MNELFTTGRDRVVCVGGAGNEGSQSSSVSFTDSEALVAPFSTEPGQAVSSTDSSVGATSYVPGDSFILDGEKTTTVWF